MKFRDFNLHISTYFYIMLESLNNFDHHLFLTIHLWRNSFLDLVMPVITGNLTWIPLYLILAFLLWKRFGKQILIILGTVAVLILFTDQSSNLIKNSVRRERPCHDEQISSQVITPLGCGGKFGFVSAHAANTLGLATFLWLLSGAINGFAASKKRKFWLLLFPWSLLICWSRIYVGVHFPFDLLCGCLVGAFWGIVMFMVYKKVMP